MSFRHTDRSVSAVTSLQDLLASAVTDGAVPGAAALVARGDEVEIGRRRRDRAGLDRPDRVDHEADHRRGGDAARRRRARGARRPDRAVAARAGLAAGRAHAREPDRRRRAGRTADHGRGPPHLPRRLGLPVRLLAAGGGRALREAPGLRAARDARTSGSRRSRGCRCSASPARRGSTTPAPTSRACWSRGSRGGRCRSSSPSASSSRSG